MQTHWVIAVLLMSAGCSTPKPERKVAADVRPDGCDLWAPTQSPGAARAIASEITGLPIDKIQLHSFVQTGDEEIPLYLGSGFGRRLYLDYVAEAVHVSRALGKPVKVVCWCNEVKFGYQVQGTRYNEMPNTQKFDLAKTAGSSTVWAGYGGSFTIPAAALNSMSNGISASQLSMVLYTNSRDDSHKQAYEKLTIDLGAN